MKPVRQLRRGVRGSCGETLLNLALIFIAALLPMSFATRAQAQTVLLNPLQNTLSNFTFGNLSFTITGCSFTYLGGSQPCLTDGTEGDVILELPRFLGYN